MSPGRKISISYSDDEVSVFHPLVEKALWSYLYISGLSMTYNILHHPKDSVGTIPDFVVTEKLSGKWVSVIEVKRTPNSVKSIRSWNQARDYVINNRSSKWSSSKNPYFIVTNMELTYFFCERKDTSTLFCLLEEGEISVAQFGSDATETVNLFTNTVISKIFDLITNQTANFSSSLKPILESFVNLQEQLSSHVKETILPQMVTSSRIYGFSDFSSYQENLQQWWDNITPRKETLDLSMVARYIARDGLLRILTYEYCREHFIQLSIHTSLHRIKGKSKNDMAMNIEFSLDDLSKIDFRQIINLRLLQYIPENLDETTFSIIQEFVEKLHKNISRVVKQNGNIAFLLNSMLQDNRLYPWKEVNGEGKVMTDPELADFVAWLSINSFEGSELPLVFEPGVGTGNIISSLYDTLRNQYPRLTHNDILERLHGCENDYFLGKLAVLNMTMKSPREVDERTGIDIKISNFFSLGTTEFSKYNLIVMNPPFLRNDNKVADLRREYLENRIEEITLAPSYMKSSSHPNYFYYFVELASKLLQRGGVFCSFISSSALSTQNGVVLKDFLLRNFQLKYIIVPPRTFFQNYQVTPCIVLGRRECEFSDKESSLEFVKIFDPDFFTIDYNLFFKNIESLEGMLYHNRIKQSDLKPGDDWRKHLIPIPSYYNLFQNSKLFSCLNKVFPIIRRGGLASEGNGSGFFFPWSNGKVKSKMSEEVRGIEGVFARKGLNNAKIPRNYILADNDLKKQEVLSYSEHTRLGNFPGLERFVQRYDREFKLPKRCYAELFPHNAQLIIPRAIRKTHAVYLNPYWNTNEVYFSSNFLCLIGLDTGIAGYDIDQSLKFITAFLNSSFGQLMFEIESIDREGLRKIEELNLNRICIPINVLKNDKEIVKEIVDEFKSLPHGLTGLEDVPSPRYKLDSAFSKLLWKYDQCFSCYAKSPEDFTKDLEKDLRNIVRTRNDEVI